MNQVLILIAGMPASGKTTFANYLSEELHIPLVCKDKLKEIMWDRLQYDATTRAETQKFGGVAYDLSFHMIEELMKAGMPLIFESNFGAKCPETLEKLVETYDYPVLTFLFDGDVAAIHKRFVERDNSAQRHPGLRSHNRFDDLEQFMRAMAPCRDFAYRDKIIRVDSTVLEQISYISLRDEVHCFAAGIQKNLS